jgi:hypothetical protein
MNDIFNEQRDFAKLVKEQEIVAAEQARIAEQQAAEQRRIDQEKREKEIAEQAAEDARKLAEAEGARKLKDAEAKVKADEERKRQEEEKARADQENIKRVHWLIIPKMISLGGVTEDQAKALILAIRDGSIPAVSIDYQWKAAVQRDHGKEGM